MAKPHPERELERLRAALAKDPPPVLAILGTADFFRREAFDLVLAKVPEGAEVRVVDGDEKTDGHELDDLRGASLFGTGSLLAVRRAGAWVKTWGKALETALERRSAHCRLLLELPKLDQRTKLAKAIEEHGACFEFRDLYAEPYDRTRSPLEAELVGWIVKRAAGLGLKLAPDAAFLILSSVGTEPAELVAELARLAPTLGNARVDAKALRGNVTCSFESTPFEFAEAVLAHDRRRAERSLHAMFARGVKGRDGASTDTGGVFPFVATWLHQALAKAWEGRRLLDAGVPARDIAARAGVRMFQDRFREQVEASSLAWLTRALHELHACERMLRSSGEDPELLLGRFVARCVGAGAVRATGSAT